MTSALARPSSETSCPSSSGDAFASARYSSKSTLLQTLFTKAPRLSGLSSPPFCLRVLSTRTNVSCFASSASDGERSRERSLSDRTSSKYLRKWRSVSWSSAISRSTYGRSKSYRGSRANAGRSYSRPPPVLNHLVLKYRDSFHFRARCNDPGCGLTKWQTADSERRRAGSPRERKIRPWEEQ